MGNGAFSPLIWLLAAIALLGVVFCGGCGGTSATTTDSSGPQATAPTGTSTTAAPTSSTAPPATAKPATTSTAPEDPALTQEKLGLHATNATGQKTFIAVLVDFPDVEREYPAAGILERITELIPIYFESASYGKLSLRPDSAGACTLPGGVASYRISPANLEVDESRVLSLVMSALNAASADVDFSGYDYITMHLGANTRDYGMVGYCAVPGMLGWQTISVTLDNGQNVENAAVFCENAHLGTYIHDILHMIGGKVGNQRLTPCLYDHELQAENTTEETAANCVVNMGFWDPLSSHFPYDRTLPPAGLSSWTKLRLGWIDPEKIALVRPGETATMDLGPLADGDSKTLVVKIPLTPTTYYLIENRQPVSSDVNLPASGILIMRCDDEVYECRNGKAPVRLIPADPSIPYLNGAAYNVGEVDRYVDEDNDIAVILQKKDGLMYTIQVTKADQAGD